MFKKGVGNSVLCPAWSCLLNILLVGSTAILYELMLLHRVRKTALPCAISVARTCSDKVKVRFSEDMVKRATVDWVKSFVVRLGLCPWAAGEVASGLNITVYSEGSVHEQYSEAEYQSLLDAVMKQSREFVESGFSSAMMVLPVLRSFEEFQMIHQIVEQELENSSLCEEVQIATFHPQYQFAETSPTEASNFTNRSPFPTFHFLRVSAVTSAIESYGDTENIWKKNISTMEKLGSEHLLKLNIEILQKVAKQSKPNIIDDS